MSREELLELLDQRDKSRKKGIGWPDRIVFAAVLILLHTFFPTPEHGLIAGISTDLKVMDLSLTNTQKLVDDHEARIRVLEHDDRWLKDK
jgi:hypothetical protein